MAADPDCPHTAANIVAVLTAGHHADLAQAQNWRLAEPGRTSRFDGSRRPARRCTPAIPPYVNRSLTDVNRLFTLG
jgi:hypothetical protein